MLKISPMLVGAGLSVLAMLAVTPALAADAQKTVVLVHGAFADASSWSKIVPLLEAKGLTVVTVDNPLTSLKADTDAATAAINAATGPVILVGHSWGGVVIGAAGNNDKVQALVYVAAFAPPPGVSVNDLGKGQPPLPWLGSVVPDSAGNLKLSAEGVAKYFAQDLPADEITAVTAAQLPTFSGLFDETVADPAYAHKPSWYIVAKQDGMIPPPAEEAMAAAIKATVVEIDSSHVAMLSKPDEVAKVILDAAAAVK